MSTLFNWICGFYTRRLNPFGKVVGRNELLNGRSIIIVAQKSNHLRSGATGMSQKLLN